MCRGYRRPRVAIPSERQAHADVVDRSCPVRALALLRSLPPYRLLLSFSTTVVRPPPGGWRVFDHQHHPHLALGRLALPSRFSGEGAVELGACVAILDVLPSPSALTSPSARPEPSTHLRRRRRRLAPIPPACLPQRFAHRPPAPTLNTQLTLLTAPLTHSHHTNHCV